MTEPVMRRDPLVDRVNELITSALDTLGMLLLTAGFAYGAWQAWGLGWGLLVAGLALTLLSMIAQAKAGTPARRPPPPPAGPAPPPGPADPGTVHVKGR